MATLTERPSGPPVAATSWSESTRVWLFQSLFTNLCGITFPDWWRTLSDNHFAIAPRSWHRAALVTAGSVLNSWYRHREDRSFGDRLDRVTVRPPLFILGHWRSGTTLLHHLLALDERFAYPNLYEVFFPHTFLCTEDDRTGLVAPLIPRTRVFDNVAQGFEMPNEDEFATAASSLCSPYMMWSFPRSTARYERYLTFRGVPEDEVDALEIGFSAVPEEAHRPVRPAAIAEIAAAHRRGSRSCWISFQTPASSTSTATLTPSSGRPAT